MFFGENPALVTILMGANVFISVSLCQESVHETQRSILGIINNTILAHCTAIILFYAWVRNTLRQQYKKEFG